MKKFYLIPNSLKEGSTETAKQVKTILEGKGAFCVEQPEASECIITLGGDGTLIQAARDLRKLQLPMIGINLGHLGYLTAVSKDEAIEPVLEALVKDDFTVEKRMMLVGKVIGAKGIRKGVALNDIVLTRKDVLQVLRFKLYLNGEFFNEYTADGMIAATPTGSTAYNLSAGGPIVAPLSNIMVLTPICSHALNSRSVVLSAQDTITLKLSEGEDKTQSAVFDGDQVIDMEAGDVLEITKAESYTTLIKLHEGSFLETLRNKMTRV